MSQIIIKQKGIGLLELLLALSIIAVLLVAVTRFATSTNASQAANNAIDQALAINTANQRYLLTTNYGSNYASTDVMLILTNRGYLPANFYNEACTTSDSGVMGVKNPFGKTTCIKAESQTKIKITISDVPFSSCSILLNRLKGTVCNPTTDISPTTCAKTVNIVTVIYYPTCPT